MRFNSKKTKWRFWPIYVLAVIIISVGVVVWFQIKAMAPVAKQTSNESTTQSTPKVPQFDMKKHSLTDADSLWVIVNKSHPLDPIDYVPAKLVNSHGGVVSSRMVADLDFMFAAAKKDGIGLTIASSYRSYSYQVNLYNNYVAANGQAVTDTFSARPGFSEHQTGLTIDFGSISAPQCNVADCYAETTAGEWLAAHALDYGFLLRYPSDKQSVTGYKFEPWHYRYIGHYLADEMKKRKITTLEEFFDVPGGEVYKA